MTPAGDAPGRGMRWPACRNARDLGGLPTPRGRTRTGRFFRSDTMTRLTDEGLAMLRASGVTTVVDLRDPPERRREPSPFATDGSPRLFPIPMVSTAFPFPVALDGGYERLLDEAMAQMPAIFDALAGSPGGAVFHCHSGTGRTGALAALILDLAGVDADAIRDDFLLSFDADGPPGEIGAARDVAPRLLEHLRRAHGGPDRYLAAAGVTAAARRRIVGRLTGAG
jgi:protein-tyrosine phosphatase